MPRDSNGDYTLPSAYNPVVADTLILEAWANETLADLASQVTSSLDRSGRGSMLAALKLVDGTVSTPGLAFSGESSSGLYRIGSQTLGVAVAGAEMMRFTPTRATLTKDLLLGTTTSPDTYQLRVASTTGDKLRVSSQTAGNGVVIDAVNLAEDTYRDINFGGTGALKYGGIEVGYRDLPRVNSGVSRGKCYAIAAGFTLNTDAEGRIYSIYNDSTSAVTITQGSGLTLRLAGTTSSGNRTLAARGFATVWYNTAVEAVMAGPGVS